MCYCPIIKLAKQLISKPSLSPEDHGCQEIIIKHLKEVGFKIETMSFNRTSNLLAWHNVNNYFKHTLVFAGHTDVVPVGNLKYWNIHPFNPKVHKGILYGRGAVDMKGSLASMIIAAKRFLTQNPYHKGRLGFIITSDEESTAQDGTVKIIKELISRNEKIDYCLIGEPSSNVLVGDNIKNGRRGSITIDILIKGIQGHVAYPNLARNPIHHSINAIKELIEFNWDKDKEYHPPTTMQVIDINTKNFCDNIIPEKLLIRLNFRYNSGVTESFITSQIRRIMKKYKISFSMNWNISSKPFLSMNDKLVKTVIKAIKYYQGFKPSLENTGGTSDGRFIISICKQIVELGPVNSTIHKNNECVKVTDLQLLSQMYQYIMNDLIL